MTEVGARPFWLIRNQEIVADGAQFPDSTAVLRWRGRTRSTGVYEHVGAIVSVHGHNGLTEIVWCDGVTSEVRPTGQVGAA